MFRSAIVLTLLCLATACAFAKDFYVAPDGKDTHAGSLSAPFASIRRAQEAVRPGDTVFIRGGTYRIKEDQITTTERNRALVICLNKSGKPGKRINYFAYRDEKPVFDFADVKPRNLRVTAFDVSASHIHIKGLAVTAVQVTITGHTQSICFDNEGSDNIYERLEMHDGQAIGFWLGRGSNNLVLNCDAYRNHDHTSGNKRGGNVDGFGFHAPEGSVNNIFRGCRAWFNSDDGFDLISTQESLLIENCWAFYNGYDTEFKSLGDGNGFKLGGFGIDGGRLPNPVPRHVTRGSLAVRNKMAGFYANHHPGGIDLLNNSAYQNGTNYNMLGRNLEHTMDVPGFGHKMINNLGYKARTEVSNINETLCEMVANSFTLQLRFDDRDFESLDLSELVAPRQPNGDLPEIRFLQLKAGNPAIDKGVDVGLPFSGKAPDLGAFERNPPSAVQRTSRAGL
jgi:hypothetical protein